MKRWIIFVALLWIAIWSAAPARADGVYYDDSHPDLIILGDAGHYEIGLRKSNGSIAYITDKATGRSVTRGYRYGCLWGASFPMAPPRSSAAVTTTRQGQTGSATPGPPARRR